MPEEKSSHCDKSGIAVIWKSSVQTRVDERVNEARRNERERDGVSAGQRNRLD